VTTWGSFGLIRTRTCPLPTPRGVAVLLLIAVVTDAAAVTSIHPFLALNAPVNGNILVVEGWLCDEALQSAVSRFEQGGYEYLVTTGGPLVRGSHLSEYGSFAELSAAILTASGFDPGRLVVIPSPPVARDRTYASALALQRRLNELGIDVRGGIDLFTSGTHGRRSRMLFEMALGPEVAVGVISRSNPAYDATSWWRSSAGVRAVMNESIAYLYARLIFSPARNGISDK
jgi:hypothetical protein